MPLVATGLGYGMNHGFKEGVENWINKATETTWNINHAHSVQIAFKHFIEFTMIDLVDIDIHSSPVQNPWT